MEERCHTCGAQAAAHEDRGIIIRAAVLLKAASACSAGGRCFARVCREIATIAAAVTGGAIAAPAAVRAHGAAALDGGLELTVAGAVGREEPSREERGHQVSAGCPQPPLRACPPPMRPVGGSAAATRSATGCGTRHEWPAGRRRLRRCAVSYCRRPRGPT